VLQRADFCFMCLRVVAAEFSETHATVCVPVERCACDVAPTHLNATHRRLSSPWSFVSSVPQQVSTAKGIDSTARPQHSPPTHEHNATYEDRKLATDTRHPSVHFLHQVETYSNAKAAPHKQTDEQTGRTTTNNDERR